jgi:hypothetical protein
MQEKREVSRMENQWFSLKRVKYFLNVHLTFDVSEGLGFTCKGIRIADRCSVK